MLQKRNFIIEICTLLGIISGLLLPSAISTVRAQEEHSPMHDRSHEREEGDVETDGHAEHGGDEERHDHVDHEGDARALEIDPEVLAEFDIEIRKASGGELVQTLRLPGEVVYNADAVTHVAPTVDGVVRKVNVSVGDRVSTGDVLAVLNSGELAKARSKYLAANARLRLARENLERDRRLFEEKVGSKRDLIESRQEYEEAEIVLRQAENTLHALGYSHDEILEIPDIEADAFNLYELKAPFSGVVTSRHLTLGEVADSASEAPFVVADLSTVWVNLTVYQRDLVHVVPGQPVTIQFGHGIPDASGSVEFLSPAVDESTRTAFARVVLQNPDGVWRPGMFVTGVIETGHDAADVVIPSSSVIGMDGRQVVFVETADGLAPREIETGRETESRIEIESGLHPGESYACGNVLALKAEFNRSALEHAGHAH